MYSLLRTYLRYAGRIGWLDGRRGYPGEEQYQELALYRAPAPAPQEVEADAMAAPALAVGGQAAPRQPAARRP